MTGNSEDAGKHLEKVSVEHLFQDSRFKHETHLHKQFSETLGKNFQQKIVIKTHRTDAEYHHRELREKEGVTLLPPVPESLLHKANFLLEAFCSSDKRMPKEYEMEENKIVVNEKDIRDSVSYYPDKNGGSVVFCYLPDLVLYFKPPMKVTGKQCPIKRSPWELMEIQYQKFMYPLEKLERQFEEVPFRPWYFAMRLKELYRCCERSFTNAANRGKARLLRGKQRTKKSYHRTVDLVSMKISAHSNASSPC
ncbi:hypothetical protein SMKI_16G1430 [Saccharomyces mikatae IFO 1815]|uniref:Uncharacterized protein n=1 Tax=Saccharomyces mikatae IFO 1815 TaxID=226126 RepID=A0AA35IVF3_SACMI|nr:uncharacterized protein SMKI_16G1430 [Saccharomyces mikatae IFO 1815]CAI4036845.1 hypothetical protein SMKI_16G1430 [Saccharomyces mikatae IFO 1815]